MAAKEKIKLEGDALAKHPTVKALAKAAGATIEVAQPSGAYARLVVQDKSGKPVTLLWLYHRPARDYVVLDNLKHRTAGMTDRGRRLSFHPAPHLDGGAVWRGWHARRKQRRARRPRLRLPAGSTYA